MSVVPCRLIFSWIHLDPDPQQIPHTLHPVHFPMCAVRSVLHPNFPPAIQIPPHCTIAATFAPFIAKVPNGFQPDPLGSEPAHSSSPPPCLQVTGTNWLAQAAISGVHMQQGKERSTALTIGLSTAQAVMGGLCLYQGFKK